jgi:hypothetical protein
MIAEFSAALLFRSSRSIERALRHNPTMLERSFTAARQAA